MATQLRQAAPASIVAVPSRPVLRLRSTDSRPETVVRVTDSTRSALLTRLTPAGIAAYCLIFPLISVGVLVSSSPGFSRGWWAVAATDGSSTEQIGALLHLSPTTVRNYLSNAITKTGGRNRIDAIRIARNAGWI